MTVTTNVGAGSAAPEMVRISVLGGSTQLDVALPTNTPVIVLVPDLVALLRIPPPAVDDPDRAADLAGWSLRRIGGSPLPAEATLAEVQVHDGELLLLAPDRVGTPPALIDDVVDGLAHLTQRQKPGWSPAEARRLGRILCLVAALVAAIAGRGLADSQPLLVAAVSGAAALVLLAATVLGRRVNAQPANIATGGSCAFIAASLAGSVVPQPNSPGPALAAAGACGLAAALVTHRCTGTAPTLAALLSTVAALTGLGGVIVLAGADELRAGAAITATLGVVAVLLSGRIAITAGRLPLPPVPNTAPTIPVIDDHAIDGLGAAPIDAIADLALADLDDLDRRTRLSAGYLTGIVVGAAAVTTVATLLTGLGYGGSPPSLLFCGGIGIALIARGRTHADRIQSAALLAAGVCSLVAVLLATGSPTVVFLGGIAVAATAFLIGVSADVHDFSPLQRRGTEFVEYAVIAAIVPLLLWLLDVYRMIREL